MQQAVYINVSHIIFLFHAIRVKSIVGTMYSHPQSPNILIPRVSFRQRVRDRGHPAGAAPAKRGQLPHPQPGRRGPPRRRPRHAPRGGL